MHLHFAEQRQIAIVWGIDDVLTVRPDLSDTEAWQVLLAAKASHDARFGINSDVVKVTAETVYGPPPEAVALALCGTGRNTRRSLSWGGIRGFC